ncbi:beta family protein [Nocardia sp. NPDC020380]|uniref:beta family protein n=1 Tax=Nocardia sp. NPDC020380 TaxID=3364309 RepID=UPI00379C60EF
MSHVTNEGPPPLRTVATTTYFPALKGKLGEMQALKNLTPVQRAATIPILDLPIDDSADSSEIAVAIDKFGSKLGQYYDATNYVIVDATMTDRSGTDGTERVSQLHRCLADDLAAVPVVTLSSSPDFVAAVAAIAVGDGNGVCIRLSREDYANIAQLPTELAGVLNALKLPASAVDLVIDVGYLDANSIATNSALIPLIIPTLPHLSQWRNLVLLSGAFPVGLSNLIAYVPQRFLRYDAELWNRVAATARTSRVPRFGDYATSHPLPGAPVARRSAPNLRYTTGNEWYCLRSDLDKVLANQTYYEICKQLRDETSRILLPESFSWGDSQIRRCASSTGGPGGAMNWKAWATSHHLTAVIENLASTGAP